MLLDLIGCARGCTRTLAIIVVIGAAWANVSFRLSATILLVVGTVELSFALLSWWYRRKERG